MYSYAVAIAVHNQLDTTKRCITALLKTHANNLAHIVMVDNGSDEETRAYLRSLGTRFRFVWNERNEGVGVAYNRAYELVRGEVKYFVALNNDMVVETADWLERMQKEFKTNVVIVGVKGTSCHLNQFGCGGDGVGPADYVEGSLMMVDTAKVDVLFDPIYRFGYGEDSDLSLRMREQGYGLGFADIKVKHERAVTSRAVERDEGVDMEGFHVFNHMTLRKRWGKYLRGAKDLGKDIAIKRSIGLGDVLMLTPAIREIKRKNPAARIYVYTKYPEVFIRNPDVTGSGHVNVAFDGFQTRFNLDGVYEMSPDRHPVMVYADAVGVRDLEDKRLSLYPSPEDRAFAATQIRTPRTVAIHAGPIDNGKPVAGRTVPEEIIRGVAAKFTDMGWGVFLIQKGQMSVHQLAAVIERCSLFVGADSGPMHLAQAMGTPTVGIFGAVDPTLRLTRPDNSVGVTADPMKVGCLGCHHVFPPPVTGEVCAREGENRNRCMKKLTVDDVLAGVAIVSKLLKSVEAGALA